MQKNVTILFGYGLFAMVVVATIFSTVVPFSALIFNPTTKHHFDTTVLLISLVAGGLLPMIVSYILGTGSTRNKDKTLHHYNGVLFGVASYWLALLFGYVEMMTFPGMWNYTSYVARPMIINSWIIVATLIVMTFVAVGYIRHQTSNVSVLHYRPYQFVLFGTAIVCIVDILVHQDYHIGGSYMLGILLAAMPVVLIGVAYWVFRKVQPSRLTRLSSAIVALTMASVAALVAGQFAGMFIPLFSVTMAVLWIAELLVWVAYLWLMPRR